MNPRENQRHRRLQNGVSEHLRLSPSVVVILLNSSAALAWGCRGHEAVALIALRDMTSMHAQLSNALLTKFPSTTKITCREVPGVDVTVQESTWADDYRFAHDETGPLFTFGFAIHRYG